MKSTVGLSLTLRRARCRVTVRQRLRIRWLDWLRKRYARAILVAKDHDQIEIERIACNIDRLEMAARIGSSIAARALAAMAIDKIGTERRRLANEASERLRAMNIRYR
jgi:hypothetical protein